jgi:hypothetical protein
MTIYSFRTKTYSNTIYVFGTNRLTARDGFTGIPAEYYVPVQQYAAGIYTQQTLDIALANGWINQQEYDETMLYRQ